MSLFVLFGYLADARPGTTCLLLNRFDAGSSCAMRDNQWKGLLQLGLALGRGLSCLGMVFVPGPILEHRHRNLDAIE